VLHVFVLLVSAPFAYFSLELTGMRRGPYLFIIMLVIKVSLAGRSGWKEHYILRFQLEFH